MYKVLLVFKDENISEKIKRMNIWGENSEFEISAVAKDGAAAYDEVRKQTRRKKFIIPKKYSVV